MPPRDRPAPSCRSHSGPRPRPRPCRRGTCDGGSVVLIRAVSSVVRSFLHNLGIAGSVPGSAVIIRPSATGFDGAHLPNGFLSHRRGSCKKVSDQVRRDKIPRGTLVSMHIRSAIAIACLILRTIPAAGQPATTLWILVMALVCVIG